MTALKRASQYIQLYGRGGMCSVQIQPSVISRTSPKPIIHRQNHTFHDPVIDRRNETHSQEHTPETDLTARENGQNNASLANGRTETILTIRDTHQSAGCHHTSQDLPPNVTVSGKYIDRNVPGRENTRTDSRAVSSQEDETKRVVSVFHTGSSFGDVTSASGRPLVLLFPWRGSSSKLRAKYSQVYHQMGLEVLCLSEGMSVPVCSVPPLISVVTRQVLHVLQDPSGVFSNRPLLVHCMSGGYMFAGSLLMNAEQHANKAHHPSSPHPDRLHSQTCYVSRPDDKTTHQILPSPLLSSKNSPNQWSTFPRKMVSQNSSKDLEMKDLRGRIIGMVLDCPVLTPYLARRGIDISVRNPLHAFLLRVAMSLFSPIMDPVYDRYARAMVTLDKTPKLLLHSSSDYLCPVSLVKEVVSELESQGVSVQVRAFPGADHVRLLGEDPEKYRQAIFQFVQKLSLPADARV